MLELGHRFNPAGDASRLQIHQETASIPFSSNRNHHLGEVDVSNTNGHSRELSISSREPVGWRGMEVKEVTDRKKITLLNTMCNPGQRMSLMLCGQVYGGMDSGTGYFCCKISTCVS